MGTAHWDTLPGTRRLPPLTPGEEFAVGEIQIHITSTGV